MMESGLRRLRILSVASASSLFSLLPGFLRSSVYRTLALEFMNPYNPGMNRAHCFQVPSPLKVDPGDPGWS